MPLIFAFPALFGTRNIMHTLHIHMRITHILHDYMHTHYTHNSHNSHGTHNVHRANVQLTKTNITTHAKQESAQRVSRLPPAPITWGTGRAKAVSQVGTEQEVIIMATERNRLSVAIARARGKTLFSRRQSRASRG